MLLAEDHSVNRAVLTHQLDAVGFRADTANDGAEAFSRFTSGDYALVLTDIHMPRMTGYELAEAIRRHEATAGWPRTPIVALSANVMHGEPERCREAGMDDFAAKPTTIPLLAAKLRQWLPHLDFDLATVDGERGDARADHGASELDPSVLDGLTGGDAALAAEVLKDFVESTEVDVGRLADAIRTGDRDAVQREAHRVKGASVVVGARHITELASEMEDGAATRGLDELVALRDELAASVARVRDRVRSSIDPAVVGERCGGADS